MGGLPRVHDKKWAQGQIAKDGGRPRRASILALILDMDEDGWKVWSRERQAELLAPYLVEGESVRFGATTGEAFIVPDKLGGMGRSEKADLMVSEIKAENAAAALWTEAKNKIRRDATVEAFAHATIDMAAEYVELERKVLAVALKDDATPAERRMAMSAWKDWKDRHMGKPVAPIEDVSQKPSDIRAWVLEQAPTTLPISANLTVDDVAEEQLRQLEAGTLDLSEA